MDKSGLLLKDPSLRKKAGVDKLDDAVNTAMHHQEQCGGATKGAPYHIRNLYDFLYKNM